LFDTEDLKNYREVGELDLMSPPLNPMGQIDAQKLRNQIDLLRGNGHKKLVLDLSGLRFIYSDTLNVLGDTFKHDDFSNNDFLGALTDCDEIIESLGELNQRANFNIFVRETDMMTWSLSSIIDEKVNSVEKEPVIEKPTISVKTIKTVEETVLKPEELSSKVYSKNLDLNSTTGGGKSLIILWVLLIFALLGVLGWFFFLAPILHVE
jgi:hypothetical protein